MFVALVSDQRFHDYGGLSTTRSSMTFNDDFYTDAIFLMILANVLNQCSSWESGVRKLNVNR